MREKMTKVLRRLAVFAVVMFAVAGIFAEAEDVNAYAYVSDLKQVAADKTSVAVGWTADEDATSYNVYIRDCINYGEYTFVGNTTNTTYAFSNLSSGMEYQVKVAAVEGTEEGGYDTEYVITLPDALTGLKVSAMSYYSTSLSAEWDELNGVTGYEITLFDNKGKKVQSEVKTSGYSNYVYFSNIKNKVYKLQVRAYTQYNGQTYYSSEATEYCMKQPQVKKGQVKNGKLVLKWNKITGATGYDIFVSTKQYSGYKKVASVKAKKSSYTVNKFKKKSFNRKKTYYVYVQAKYKKGKVKVSSPAVHCWKLYLKTFY